MNIFNFSYRKVGGLRFVRIGRFGFSFWVSRTQPRARVYEGGPHHGGQLRLRMEVR